jgi:protein-S-isoprenylcysteine O-methyltransferase Ste14
MKRILLLVYGVAVYAVSLVTLLYAVGFVGNFQIELWEGFTFVPKGMDSPKVDDPFLTALVINALVLGLFAVQHSVMARPAFKKAWTKIVPEPIERSTYVLATNLALIVIFYFWRPMGDVIWDITDNDLARRALIGASFLGWGIALIATLLINHFDLFGLRQIWYALQDKERPPLTFGTPAFYKVVRHPLYFGFTIAFWATPIMTVGHLVFSIATTGYILVGIQLEERDLINAHGEVYRGYKRRVAMLIPRPPRR